LTVLSLGAFGPETWTAFLRSLEFTRRAVLEEGNIGWEKIQSAFSATRMLSGSVPEAYAIQAVVTAFVLGAIAWLWHSQADRRLKYASLLCGALLTTPYCLDYDMVLIGPAVAFFVANGLEKGFFPFEKAVLAAAWLAPLIARIASKLGYMPLGAISMCALFATIILRAISEAHASSSPGQESPSQLQPSHTLHVVRPRLDKAELGSKPA
jgi:hypothetical protein